MQINKMYEVDAAKQKERCGVVEKNGISYLVVHYHKFLKDHLINIDARKVIPMLDIQRMRMVFGPRLGFKRLQLEYKIASITDGKNEIMRTEIFKISNNHKNLVNAIVNLLEGKIPLVKEVIEKNAD